MLLDFIKLLGALQTHYICLDVVLSSFAARFLKKIQIDVRCNIVHSSTKRTNESALTGNGRNKKIKASFRRTQLSFVVHPARTDWVLVLIASTLDCWSTAGSLSGCRTVTVSS